MKSFGELLTEYMTHTGISDSELARHLGISRQTIFRWKEGVTARPRVREDVLKCADRLRLTPSERDALLLAAGFAPETRPASAPSPSPIDLEAIAPAPVEPVSVPAVMPTAVTFAPAQRPVRQSRWGIWLLVFLLVLVGLSAAVYFLIPQARDGVLALVLPPTPTPPTPPDRLIAIAKLNSRGGVPPPYDVTARLRQALEQEIAAQNLAGIRIVELADTVRDDLRADQLRTRAGAKVVIWGNFSGDNSRVEMGTNSRLPLKPTAASVIPILPRDQSVTLDTRVPQETRALALLLLLPLQLDGEGAERAAALVQEAQTLTPLSNEMRAAIAFYNGYLLQTTDPRNLPDAVRAYTTNLRTTSLYEAFLNRGLAQLALNEDAAAKADFQRAQQIGDVRAEAWRATCWAYVLEQQPQAALPFCQASATRDATGWSFDTRGIVYAELGRYADAANELDNFMRWLDTQPSATRAMFVPTRRSWIDTLRAGKNPFDVATLNALRGGE